MAVSVTTNPTCLTLIRTVGLSWQLMMAVIYMIFLDAEFLEGPGSVWMSWGLLLYNVTLFGVIVRSAIVAIADEMSKDKKLGLLRNQVAN